MANQMVELTGDVWVNAEDILYIRPQEGGGCFVELRSNIGFGDRRSPRELIESYTYEISDMDED